MISMSLRELNVKLPDFSTIREARSRLSLRTGLSANASSTIGRCASLAGFVREAWPILHPTQTYQHNWHIDLICEHLEAISRGTLLELGLENRLRVNLPAGTLKSVLISCMWQAWEWGPFG